jgi:outer membrane protein assembly factor BamE
MPKFSIPRVYKATVQQGNVITQEMIDQLKPGMTRSQVRFVMGDPVIQSTFDADRWDYVYTIDIPGFFNENRRVSLYFDQDLLAYFTGDYAPTEQLVQAAEAATASEAAAIDDDADATGNAGN